MRLLKTDTLELVEFIGNVIPLYAILSHTWEDEEVTYQEMQLPEPPVHKRGYQKIQDCCRLAREDRFEYCWIDTCW